MFFEFNADEVAALKGCLHLMVKTSGLRDGGNNTKICLGLDEKLSCPKRLPLPAVPKMPAKKDKL